MGLFEVSHRWFGAKRPPTRNLLHVFHNHETWRSYALPKGDPKTSKIYKSHDTSLPRKSSAASRCILVPFERYRRPKNSDTFSTYILRKT